MRDISFLIHGDPMLHHMSVLTEVDQSQTQQQQEAGEQQQQQPPAADAAAAAALLSGQGGCEG